MNRRERMPWVLSILVTGITLDLVTKSLAVRYLPADAPLRYLGDSFRLQYVENRGAFLSLGASLDPVARAWIFIGLVSVVLAGIAVYLAFARRLERMETIAFALVLAGGIGNLVDRASLGYVRDFANVGIGPVRTGVFNIADMAIMAAAGLLAWFALRGSTDKQEAPGAGGST